MAQPTVLKTEVRAGSGSASARRDRRAGRIPVNIYGHGEGNQHLLIDEHDLGLALRTSTQVFTLTIGGAEQPCLVKAVQYDTFGQHILHVDFTRVSMTEEVEVEVTLEFVGTPKGVADGGQLVVNHPALWVRCLANAIPDVINVDIAAVEMGNGVSAGEITLPPGVSLDLEKMEPGDQIVGVAAPRAEEPEEAPEDEAVEGEGAPEGAPAEGEAAPAEGDASKEKDKAKE
ncbi:MAG: 50S ribosomal protein L25 [Planctomycetota bacterium]